MSNVLNAFRSITPLTDEDCDQISALLHIVKVAKGEPWIKAGHKNEYVAFVESGYLRKFFMKDGTEITDSFYFDNDFCADLPSLIGNHQPYASIIAMTDTVLSAIPYHSFNEFSQKSLALEHLHRVMVEGAFLRFYNRTVSFILQTPKERYDELVKGKSVILQNATQYHIASYLGVSPQHLSRIRAEN